MTTYERRDSRTGARGKRRARGRDDWQQQVSQDEVAEAEQQQQRAATTARYLELDSPSAQLHCICCCGHAHSLRGVLLTEHCLP